MERRNANPDIDDRLARLAERRAASRRVRTERRHPAAASRLVAAGLSSSAFLSIIAALGAQTPAAGSTTVAAAPPPRSLPGPTPTVAVTLSTTGGTVVVKVASRALPIDKHARVAEPADVVTRRVGCHRTRRAASHDHRGRAEERAYTTRRPGVRRATDPADGALDADYDASDARAHHDATADLDDEADDHHGLRSASAPGTAGVHRIEMPLSELQVDNYWSECRARAMGSTAHLVLGDAPAGLGAWALAEIERLEQCWSRFRSDSELARLHARAGDWVDVSAPMLLALTCARDLHRSTHGLFDPTILVALERAGYDRTFEEVVAVAESPRPSPPAVPGFDRVEIDVDDARVRMPAGLRLDLGGVGKGLAADVVSRGLVDRGVRSALVSIGGDMRARGTPPESGWRVPVEHPFDAGAVAFVYPLAGGALVSSTRRIRAWKRADREYHHIIDPRTGDSTRSSVVAVVATAGDAWWAEGIAKAILIAGVDAGIALARATGVRAWLFLESGDVRVTGA